MISILKTRESQNALWLICGKICQMILGLVVGVLSARYLGPSNYGLINYAAAYVAFFTSLCTLGINSVIIKDFVDNPNECGKAIGTAILLRLISSVLSTITIISFVGIIDGDERLTIVVVSLSSLSLIFNIFDTFNSWFQYIYKSKITAISIFIAYFTTAVYKIVLLVLQKDVQWFAFATSVDHIILAFVLWMAYRNLKGPRLSFSIKKAKQLLGKSYHYILSGMMVAVYGHTDKLMLKQMMTDADVGYYSTATAICGMWVFVLSAIIDAMYPTILRLHKTSGIEFEKKNKQLYALVFYISAFVSLLFTFFGTTIIKILYGEAYLQAALPLRVITWYTAFSYLGVARNAWIVCENRQKYLKYMYVGAAIGNVGLNFVLIPVMGATGAAFASLATQIATSILLPLFFKEMRGNVKLIGQAILLKGLK